MMFESVLKFVNLKSMDIDGVIGFKAPVNESIRTILQEELSKCVTKYNGFCKISIQPPYKKRTTGKNSQNHKLNGSIQIICRKTGNDFDDVKMYIKRKALRRGYPIMKNSKGEPVISLLTGEPVPESETRINTVQCAMLIDEMLELAAELGITLPGD